MCVFVYVAASVNVTMGMFVTPDCALQLKQRSSGFIGNIKQDASK